MTTVEGLAQQAISVVRHPLVTATLRMTIAALAAAGAEGISSAMWTQDDVVVSALLGASGLVESVGRGRHRLTESTRRRLKPTREARPC